MLWLRASWALGCGLRLRGSHPWMSPSRRAPADSIRMDSAWPDRRNSRFKRQGRPPWLGDCRSAGGHQRQRGRHLLLGRNKVGSSSFNYGPQSNPFDRCGQSTPKAARHRQGRTWVSSGYATKHWVEPGRCRWRLDGGATAVLQACYAWRSTQRREFHYPRYFSMIPVRAAAQVDLFTEGASSTSRSRQNPKPKKKNRGLVAADDRRFATRGRRRFWRAKRKADRLEIVLPTAPIPTADGRLHA